MARPTKQGIDYFPMDCKFDDKTELFLIEKGRTGFTVLISLWQMIYFNEGYFIEDNKDLHLLVKRKIDVDINEVSDCINLCLQRGIFDEVIYKKHKILTSKAIQKRYFEAAKKKKTVNVNENYLCNGIDSRDNWVNVGVNATNVNVNVNVKGKVKEKVKVKENKTPDKTISEKQFSDEDFKLAEFMFEKIQVVADKTKKPNLKTWAEVIRLMRERDKYHLEEIRDVFTWANQDSFWATNILSPGKLRKQFATLSAKAKPKVSAISGQVSSRRRLSA